MRLSLTLIPPAQTNMVHACAVVGCSNRNEKQKHLSFFLVPKVITNQCKKTLELSKSRRAMWLARISRKDLTDRDVTAETRVCSVHFISGTVIKFLIFYESWQFLSTWYLALRGKQFRQNVKIKADILSSKASAFKETSSHCTLFLHLKNINPHRHPFRLSATCRLEKYQAWYHYWKKKKD